MAFLCFSIQFTYLSSHVISNPANITIISITTR
jgi:hypothetical protein